MTLPPLWKVKRELKRIRLDMWRGLRGALLEPPRQWLYDRQSLQQLRLISGRGVLTERVAVLVLFQPKGLANSVRLTLDHLVAEGWSVVVVSNAPLSISDTSMVTDRAALVLERPNIGYDFGGYRAGLQLLKRIDHRPEQLIMINDSTWFPLRADDDTLRRMEALGADMAGHIFRTEGKKGRDHLESHLLMFSSKALRHPVWSGFWRKFVMSNDRVTTISRGEKGLSQSLMSAGLRVVGLIERESFLNRLNQLNDADLWNVINNLVHHRPEAQKYCNSILQSRAWRSEFLDWATRALTISRQHLVSTTFVAPAMQLCNMNFVKKSHDHRFHLARIKVLELDAAGLIKPLHPEVRAEIVDAVDARASIHLKGNS